ncbi:MAG: phosphoribosylformylglycinamidine cyclo-ligase [Chloroflexi bacterium]|nr:phosphoribosylformylglycinamidine cyclo-ligase [Chloroflexota bacterium]
MSTPPRRPRLTYAAAGVDIAAAARAKRAMAALVRSTFTPGVRGDFGAFGSLFQVQGFSDPVLVASTDGVGTKLKLAFDLGRHDTVGQDLVNHCVNDILTCGARPLFFLDYLALGRLDEAVVQGVIAGLAAACKAAGCALLGGETAEMPGLYAPGDYDLAGFIVGAVERDQVLDGSRIVAGDLLLGLPSSGLHTNGYSLARRVFDLDAHPQALHQRPPELGGRTLGEALLAVHRPYWPLLQPALPLIKGMAHITGGGLPGNLPRALPDGLGARLRKGSWPVPPIFALIQARGGIADAEMYNVFNLGLGLVLAAAPADAAALRAALPEALPVGQVVRARGRRRVRVE